MNGRLWFGGALRLLFAAILAIGSLALGSLEARAQDGVSAQQRKAAAEAYDRGTSAWLAGQYAQAAQWFETAHRLAPSPAALVQAIRSHSEAGNSVRAASLSLWLQSEYDADERAMKVAKKILEDAQGNYTRVVIHCDGDCSITADGKVQEYNEFFVQPGVEHEITAGFEYGDKTETMKGSAGETVEASFEAPPKPPEPEPGEPGYEGPPPQAEPWEGLPLWATVTMMSVTAGLAGATVWSAVDTNNAADAYEDWALAGQGDDREWGTSDDCEGSWLSPEECEQEVRQRLDEGQDLERRTNILIGVTAGVAAVTTVFAIFFTDWSGEESDTVEEEQGKAEVTAAGVTYQPGGAMAAVEGRF